MGGWSPFRGVSIQGEGVSIQGEGVSIQAEGISIQGEGVSIQGEGVSIQMDLPTSLRRDRYLLKALPSLLRPVSINTVDSNIPHIPLTPQFHTCYKLMFLIEIKLTDSI